MIIHLRNHEMGRKPRIRIWTDEMANYGQFDICSYDDIQTLKNVMDKLGTNFAQLQYHRCDGMGECKCRILTYGEQIPIG